VCQNIAPYNSDPVAPLLFDEPEEAMEIIRKLCTNRQYYLNESDAARKVATGYWLEDHIEEHVKVYFPS